MQKKQTVDNFKIFGLNFMIIFEMDEQVVMNWISGAQTALDASSLLDHDGESTSGAHFDCNGWNLWLGRQFIFWLKLHELAPDSAA